MSRKDKGQAQVNNASEGDAIQVFVRVRPSESYDADTDFGQCLEVRLPDTIIMHCKPEPKVFTYDHVTDANTTQESVFTAVGKRIIESCVGGYNGTIFAYGQTGSGKTFTMLGPCEDGDNFHHELRGVIPRSFEYLFSLVNREREKHGDRYEFLCRCSFLEIYNEQIFDLLDPASMGLHLRENMKKGVFVDGLIERAVASPSEAYGVLTAGWHNRRVAATSMNRESSRSHAVFTVSIESKEKKAGVSNIRVSQLHLVDLAGSERQKDTKAVGVRLKEAGSINKSLSILGNVIMALVDIAHGKQRHVPYRDSKLSFLLRDSLGGNAKTYIIANVHPDAKCFGETLSTLKFARRAKMIKNRAVVNEDTQGNVMHLQAEIRRLREALAMKGAEGSIPRGPSAADGSQLTNGSMDGNGQVSGQQASSSSSKWKKYFLEAMSLRDAVEVEKRDLREKVASLEELCSKRDQVISSNKMIIKFRNSTIDMLQKTKNKAATKEDRDIINENLKKEIEQLHEQLEHNPFVMRYVVENQSLRAQNKKLKAMEAVQSGAAITAAKEEELEKLFLELREGLSQNRRFSITPNSTPVDGENVATSTLVILKSQIKKLQDELENAKQEHAEQEEMTRKTRLELESELAAYKKANSDLEKTLEGMKVKNKLDRDAMNDIHMQTIKKITTPKKVSYNLRSRLVMRASGETPGGPGSASCDSPVRSHSASSLASGDMSHSPAFAEEGIIDEEMPEHVVEQCNEALTVELQKLQGKYATLQQQLEDHESQKHKMMQNTSKLEHQLQQITELHTTESKAWQEQEQDLNARLAEATSRISTLQREYEITKGEAEDFRVLLQAADKELGQEKKQKSEVTQDWDKARAALDAQVVRLENELCSRSRELENLMEDREQLQDAYSTLQEEHEFQQQREADLESRLKGKKAEIMQLQEEIQKHLEKLDSECDKNMRLTAELRQGDNTKQDLLAAQELIDQFREERDDLLQRLDAEALKLCASKEELDTATSALTALRKTDLEQKEALSSLMSALQDQKGMVKEKEEQLASLQMQLEDTRGQVSLLEGALEEGKANAEGLQNQLTALEDRLHSQAGEHQEQIERMRADAMDASQHQKELLRELEKQSEELSQLHKQMKEREAEFETKELELQNTVQSLEQQLEEVKTNLSTVVVELDDEPEAKRRRTADSQAIEIESLRESERRFQEMSAQYDSMRDRMNEEIKSLKLKADELEEVRIAREILQTQNRALTYEIEGVRNEMAEKESSLKDELFLLKRDVEHQKTLMTTLLGDKEEAVEKLNSVQTALDQAKANEEILQESMDQVMEELDRTSALESAHFKEKEDIKSKLEEEREEKSKLMKEVTRLKEAYEDAEKKITELGGHQNPKQKIHHFQAVKTENHLLKEDRESLEKQLGKTQSENERMKREQEVLQKKLDQLISSTGVGRGHQVARMPSTTLKENSDPEMNMDTMCSESAYTIGTRALFGNLMP